MPSSQSTTRTKTRKSSIGVSSDSGSRTDARTIRWLACALAVAGLALYGNTLSNPFLLDDTNSIVNNQQIRDLSPSRVFSPPRETPVAGRPIVNLSLAVNYAVGGLDVTGYHIGNIVIHVLAALVLFGVVRRTLLLPALAPWAAPSSTIAAWTTALLWMVHPLQTEPVSYLSQRTELMMGLFFLLTLYCTVRGFPSGEGGKGTGGREKGQGRWRAGAVAACALGMACKETMAVAPLAVLLYDRVFRFDSLREAFRLRGALYAGLAATWIVPVVLLSGTPRTSAGFGAVTDAGTGAGVWTYLLNQCEMIVRYLRLAVWPRDLVIDYGLPRMVTLGDVLPEALAVVALLAATLLLLWKRPLAGFCAAWFFLTLAPTSSILPIATEVGADRRMYLPLAGLIVLAVVGVTYAGRTFTVRRDGRSPRAFIARGLPLAAALVVAALLAAGTVLRNREYQSPLTMAETVVERWPNGRGHFVLGVQLVEVGRRDEAIAQFRAAAPDYPPARLALATELVDGGDLAGALDQLQAFLAEFPRHPASTAARDMLGRLLLSQGRTSEGVEQLRLVSQDPTYPRAREAAAIVQQLTR